ncbi:macrophage mannose receptor 1-like [Hypomesus transpacificus]|uniref:macrophage mannose receptor 1-like n=1 Tax=Hypomesus transpacificus TaxID=137520 RepID=UPI001F08145A|nr:macrophage mannose receptor 1-like [Hypomesus transpacificus]
MNQLLCRGIKHCPGRWGGDTDSRSELTPAAPTAFTHPTSVMEKSVLLMLLFLSGLSILPSCLSFHYEYVNENKNWYEAQRICRENYTDLATFYDNASIPDQTNDAWIGLYSGLWTWSLNGEVLPCNETSCGSDYAPWSGTELQTEYVEDELCVYMEKLDPGDKPWKTSGCSNNKSFVCYDDRNNTSQYIWICETKTWNESQSYCRANHTDLASVRNATENNLIQNLCSSRCNDNVWIGLRKSKNWKWSDQSVSSFKKWHTGEPSGLSQTNVQKKKNLTCVERYFHKDDTKKHAFWNDVECRETYKKHFICYDDDLVLVRENKTWVEALNHCREYRWDLVSIHSERIQHWVQRRARKATTPYVWLGLRYTCILQVWFWVSEQALCHQNWAPGHGTSWEECKKSGAMPREGPQQWEGMHQTEKLNFICTKKPHDY